LSLQPTILDLQTLFPCGVCACRWLLTRGCSIGSRQRNVYVRLGSRNAVVVDNRILLFEPAGLEK
jgi:hypothetical protein